MVDQRLSHLHGFTDLGVNALANAWFNYLMQVNNMTKHFLETKFHQYFVVTRFIANGSSIPCHPSWPVYYCWFGFIGESAITPHRQYNQSENQPGIEMALDTEQMKHSYVLKFRHWLRLSCRTCLQNWYLFNTCFVCYIDTDLSTLFRRCCGNVEFTSPKYAYFTLWCNRATVGEYISYFIPCFWYHFIYPYCDLS